MTDHATTLAAAAAARQAAIEAHRAAIVAAYKDGWTLNQIAEAADITKAGAGKIITAAGVQMRPRGGSLPRSV